MRAALVTAAICAAAAASFARFVLLHLLEAPRITGHQPPCDEPHSARWSVDVDPRWRASGRPALRRAPIRRCRSSHRAIRSWPVALPDPAGRHPDLARTDARPQDRSWPAEHDQIRTGADWWEKSRCPTDGVRAHRPRPVISTFPSSANWRPVALWLDDHLEPVRFR